jgi:hypothetical protein
MLQISINIPTVTDRRYIHNLGTIIHRTNHTIIANAHPPEIIAPLKFDHAGQMWIFTQHFDFRQNSVSDGGWQFSNSLRAERAKVML